MTVAGPAVPSRKKGRPRQWAADRRFRLPQIIGVATDAAAIDPNRMRIAAPIAARSRVRLGLPVTDPAQGVVRRDESRRRTSAAPKLDWLNAASL